MKIIVNYGKGTIFTLNPAPVTKKAKDGSPIIDVAKTIDHVRDIVGKDADFQIA